MVPACAQAPEDAEQTKQRIKMKIVGSVA
jgi:hypothetical protein